MGYLAKALEDRNTQERGREVVVMRAGGYHIHYKPAQDDTKMYAIYATKPDGTHISDGVFLPVVENALKQAGVEDANPHVIARGLIKIRRSDLGALERQLKENATEKSRAVR